MFSVFMPAGFKKWADGGLLLPGGGEAVSHRELIFRSARLVTEEQRADMGNLLFPFIERQEFSSGS